MQPACITVDICTDTTAAEFGPSLRAVEFKTGAVKWSQDQFRAGITLVGDKLLVIREGGE